MTAKFDIKGLIRATELSFQILQPFYKNKSSSDAAFKQIKDLTDAYIRAIEHSLDCSDRGIDICRDVLELHNFFEQKKPEDYIQPFLTEVVTKAEEARGAAEVMAKEFATVQEGLQKMYNEISSPKLKQGLVSGRSWKDKIAELVTESEKLVPEDNGLGAGQTLATVLEGAHPLLLIIIPLAISFSMLALRVAASYINKKRKIEADTREDISQRLLILQEQVSKFVKWWTDMEDKIVGIQEAYLKAGREGAMALLLKPEWDELQCLYTVYNDQIRKIRDSYPECRSEAPAYRAKPARYRSFKRVPLRPVNKSSLAHGLLQAHRVAWATTMTVTENVH